jgi:transposase, IS6 family
VEEMMSERGWPVDHRTIHRWVLQFGPELDKRCRPHLKPTNDSWKVDEIYIKVGGIWQYLYQAVDSDGQTLDFLLSPRRDAVSAECFLRQALFSEHPTPPRVINTDKNPAYPKAVADLQAQGRLSISTTLRQVKYLNNLIEQDPRLIKRLSKPGLGFKSWRTAWRTIRGYESMNMIRKGQIKNAAKGDILAQIKFVESVFSLVA